jgi:cell division transport system ATP-binding protein
VFQDFKLLEDRNVFENVALALHVTGAKKKEVNKKVLKALAEVGLSHKKNNMPEELSGGEQQRVAIARAIANEPFLILADEPTGNLDPDTSIEIIELLKKINLRGTSIIMATHNYSIIERVKDAKVYQISNFNLTQIK